MKRWELFEEATIAGAGLVLGFMLTMGVITGVGSVVLYALGIF